ncbi:MAG: NMD3-related protein [Thermofilum sp.]
MVHAVCPLCGRFVESLVGGLCPQCYRANHPLIQLKKEIVIQRCRICGAYKYGDSGWTQEVEVLEEEIRRKANRFLVFGGRVTEVVLRVRPEDRILEVKVKGVAHGLEDEPYWENLTAPLKLRETVCDGCMRHLAKRAAATVQVRAEGRELTGEERRAVQEALAALAKSKGLRTSQVPIEVEEVPHGVDVHFATHAAAREFVRILSEKVFFDVLETSKLVGITRSGREKHKQTLRLLLPKFKKGDVIELKGNLYLVEDIRASKLILLDLERAEKTTIPLTRSTLNAISVHTAGEELEHGVVISRSENLIYVMSMRDNSLLEVEARGPKAARLVPGSRVSLLRREGIVYLVTFEGEPSSSRSSVG